MQLLRTISLRLRSLFRRRAADRELDSELRFHIEKQIAANIASGMTPVEARRQAFIEFGGVEELKEECRDMRKINWLQDFAQDVRFGLRMLRKSPGFTTVAVLTLALGIGATTAVFSVVDRVLFRALPYPASGRLVSFGFIAPVEPNEFILLPDLVDWTNSTRVFASTTSYDFVQDCDITQAPAARVSCVHVSAEFLPTFGIQPLLGRNFTREEDASASPKVALLFYGLWKSRFGGDPGIVGKTVSLDGQPTAILGVLPQNFELPTLAHADFLLPEALAPNAFIHSNNRPMLILRAFGRLNPGVSIAQAKAALEPSFENSLKWIPPGFRSQVRLSVRSLRDRQTADARLASWVLFGAVLAVLLIACANVANLLLARSAVRQSEFAIRAALGAGSSRLFRQALTESAMLSLAGAALGCGFAVALLRIFVAISPRGILHLEDASLDFRVLAFTLAVSVISGIFFGLTSAQRTVRQEALYARAASGLSRRFFRRALVSLQIAVSFVLLAGASLLIRSVINLERSPLGMDASGVLISTIALNPRIYSDMPRRLNFFEGVEQRLPQLPGVSAFAMSDTLPPSGQVEVSPYANIQVPGRPPAPQGTGGMVANRTITPGFFAALEIPVLHGRPFTADDRSPNASVVILNSVLAERLFSGEDAIGKRVRFQPNGSWFTVVGVSGSVKYIGGNGFVAPAESEYYFPLHHNTHYIDPQQRIILRSQLDPSAVAAWMRKTVASLDPTVPVTIDAMSRRLSQLEAPPRFNAALLGIFAALGIFMAALGTYGVLAYLVTQRTREIGIRLALGAQSGEISHMILRQGLNLAFVGIAVGLAVALAISHLLAGLVYGVKPNDPVTFIGAAILLAFVALAACYIPARRAMRVDPMVALRYE